MTDGPHPDRSEPPCHTCGYGHPWVAPRPDDCPACHHASWCWVAHPDQPDRGAGATRASLRVVGGSGRG